VDDLTQFDYLLNAMERAGQEKAPAEHGYAEKRLALFAYVRALEAQQAGKAEHVGWLNRGPRGGVVLVRRNPAPGWDEAYRKDGWTPVYTISEAGHG
jgi:hypothetical protein